MMSFAMDLTTPMIPTEPTTTQMINRWSDYENVSPYLILRIADCESGGTHYDTNGKVLTGEVNPQDVGIMQINLRYHGEHAKSLGFDVFQESDNIHFGIYLIKTGGAMRYYSASAACWGSDRLLTIK